MSNDFQHVMNVWRVRQVRCIQGGIGRHEYQADQICHCSFPAGACMSAGRLKLWHAFCRCVSLRLLWFLFDALYKNDSLTHCKAFIICHCQFQAVFSASFFRQDNPVCLGTNTAHSSSTMKSCMQSKCFTFRMAAKWHQEMVSEINPSGIREG